LNKKLAAGLLVGLGLVIVLFFSLRIIHVIRRWNGPPHPQPRATTTDTTLIRDWMTIPYIAHTYAVPDRMLFKVLEIPEQENRTKSLIDINNKYFPGQKGFVITRIQQAILEFQAHAPLPDSPPNGPAAPTP
jgi:hypothetical protein